MVELYLITTERNTHHDSTTPMIGNPLDTSRRTLTSIALATLIIVSAGAAVSFTASAAGSTTVSITPSDQQVEPGATTTYEIVVENTDNGIGTTNADVTLEDPSVGTITDVEIAGEPANQNVNIASDGSSASFDAIYFGNALSDDPNGVTIATITVRGSTAGSSDLSLDVTEISDSSGGVYDVTGTNGASFTVSGQATATPTETATETPTETATPTETQTPAETSTTETQTPTQTETPTTTATSTSTETTTTTETTIAETPTATETPSENETPTETTTPTEPATPTPTETPSNASAGGSGGGTDASDNQTAGEGGDDDDRPLDQRSISDSLAGSNLSDTQINQASETLAASGLSDAQITTITDALAGDGLTAEQQRAVSDAIAGELSDQQLSSLSDALSDGQLTDTEREALGFLNSEADADVTDGGNDAAAGANGKAKTDGDDGAAGDDSDIAYYQVDLVIGEPIENLRGPNGTYANSELVRFAHGSSQEPIARRSDGEFITDSNRAKCIRSQNITVKNGTATTTFTIGEDCEPVELSLVSYEKVGPGWSPETEALQEFVDAETDTFGPDTYTLTVDLPDSETTEGNHSLTSDT